jgi:hypothetical protein
MNELDAIRLIVANFPGGLEVVALRIGKPAETLRKEIAGAQNFKLGVVHAAQISAMAIDAQSPHCYAFINAIAGDSGRMLELPIRDVEVSKQDLRTDAASLMKEGTDVLMELNAALADEQISDNELARIEREAAEVLERTQAIVRGARARNLAGKPVLRVA